MIDELGFKCMLREMTWVRARGELQCFLATFRGEVRDVLEGNDMLPSIVVHAPLLGQDYESMKKLVNEFIERVDDIVG